MNIEDQIDPSISGFVRPNYEYKGIELNPFAPGWKVLFHQATVSDDKNRNSGAWVSTALLFLLSLKKEEAKKLAFNREEFRSKALDWFETIEGDIEEATLLAEEILTKSEQTKVEVSDGGTDPKND